MTLEKRAAINDGDEFKQNLLTTQQIGQRHAAQAYPP
jgi:hypothetical protein